MTIFAPLGKLAPDEQFPDWLLSEPTAVPYFSGARLTFVVEGLEEDDAPEEFAAAVDRFPRLSAADRAGASQYVFKNYTDILEAVGPEDVDVEITQPENVWNHVQPSEIRVTRRHRRDRSVYVQIDAECDWEPEHGLLIVYRNGNELSRVSDQDGHLTHTDAYDLPEQEDRIA